MIRADTVNGEGHETDGEQPRDGKPDTERNISSRQHAVKMARLPDMPDGKRARPPRTTSC